MASSQMRFDGRVVLITGAGGGLGRQYALAFAERGASVVVNDLGSSPDGSGHSLLAADKVVNEIQAKGGKAVADYHSVEEGEKLVQTAVNAFGRIDILVNNAGILRDRSFSRISEEDWDSIYRVHLHGSFLVTRAAWPYMKKQNYGRIIMTSSGAGLYGNFGQANYSAAKMGLLGLSNTLAIEGQKYNITSNTIAPLAGSRLTQNVMPPDLVESLKPEYVAPLVLYLCHETCTDTGGIFEVAAGWISKLRWERTAGAILKKQNKSMTIEDVRDNWEKICNFDESTHPDSLQDHISLMMDILQQTNCSDTSVVMKEAESSPQNGINVELAKSFSAQSSVLTYDHSHIILYALAVGISTKEPDHLKFLFEGSEDFCALPTFCIIPAQKAVFEVLGDSIPGLEVDLVKVLHGEQYMEIFQPIPTSGELISVAKIADILDKGFGAAVLINVETFNKKKEKIAFNQFNILLMGSGNFGGLRSSPAEKPIIRIPNREPDMSIQQATSVNQAAMYRLCGDFNPLHIDPKFAALGGHPQPILHGLCSLGFAVRHVMKNYADNDPTLVNSIKVRFSKPFSPGHTLKTEMWKGNEGIHFQCQVVETGKICLSGGFVGLASSASPLRSSITKQATSKNLLSDQVFEQLARKLQGQLDLKQKINAVFLWNITQNGEQVSQWTLDLTPEGGGIYPGQPHVKPAQCILSMEDKDIIDLKTGKLNPEMAFISGQLKIIGSIDLCKKLSKLFINSARL